MKSLNREQAIAVGVACLLLLACISSLALSLASRADAAQELAQRQEILSRLEARAHQGAGPGGIATKPATAPAEAFLEAPTAGLAGADLQSYIAGLADQHAAVVSFGLQPSGGQDNAKDSGKDNADEVRIEASMDINLHALQVLLYQLESGTPYVFLESMTIHPANADAEQVAGDADPTLRVTLGLHALWRRRAA